MDKTSLDSFENLEEISKSIRKNIIEMVYQAQSGHPGGSLSVTDILTVLYFDELRVNVNNVKQFKYRRTILWLLQ